MKEGISFISKFEFLIVVVFGFLVLFFEITCSLFDQGADGLSYFEGGDHFAKDADDQAVVTSLSFLP